ncbi:hypothetical protein HYH02_001591 [Chlamydomonas schloesseri]|uniref:CHRD domain-containing protein n=1 Tax=Chlamydomonas schloesseri TaxID=2026947 RepID=A0A836BB94_9CHLO|nr:hypothetical protein HYH02_001591 [Chlamydomonas schloesseri]|eukprot:KAG2453367.1 hypothetical protein HYH02_001591 [Chlamydomonas schloesseri]
MQLRKTMCLAAMCLALCACVAVARKSGPKWPDAPAGAIVAVTDLAPAPKVYSKGKGRAYLILPKGGPYTSFVEMTGEMANVTMSHVHWSNASAGNPPRLGIFPSLTSGAPVLLSPPFHFKGSVSFTRAFNSTDLGYWAPGGVDAFVALLKSGALFVNVHTVANPGGELQGALECKSPCMWT